MLANHSHTGEAHYLVWAVNIALDWARQHPVVEPDRSMAWYDMAIGLRAYKLGYLVDAAARTDQIDHTSFALLLSCAKLHLEALADARFFAPHSNHGFYVAAGQMALVRRLRGLPGMGPHREQARARVHQLIQSQFTSTGVHREHSPDYHKMVLNTFEGLVASGLLDRAEFAPLIDRIQEALAWFVLPNSRLAMFGDTIHRDVLQEHRTCALNPALEFVLTQGAHGKPPGDRWRSFDDAGYFVARDRWPTGPQDYGDCSYLAQTASFHSRVHKHADDLSMVWYDRGHELLVDSGKFGYPNRTTPDSELGRAGFYYAHPSRVYVESTRAHNTVEIDGRSYQRRGVKPYGSGLLQAGEHQGVLYSGTHVRHNKTIRHARVLAFRPGEWLLVYAWLWDNLEQPHTYTQRFHFAPELDLCAVGAGFEAALPDTRLHVAPLLPATPLDPVRGQNEPDLLGWISRQDGELRPCWTSAYQINGEASCSMATLLGFGERAPAPGRSTASARGDEVHLRWSQGGEHWEVSFGRPDREDFHLTAGRSAASGRTSTLEKLAGWLRGPRSS
ncbi:hypothetical protein GCM10009642_47430 [Nocardiopsis metallicus]|uniref:Heparin-sulfate lyase N-terminal domain-containing protein n=1 Tax=Nocardiopsis metallicus TaxID=179819 RepID=A0A840W1U1_9ACTN|nr:hypothetical protein [Nocardiopsis metallicus]